MIGDQTADGLAGKQAGAPISLPGIP